MTRSSARRRGFPPRPTTAAASFPHSRATAASTGSGSNVASTIPRRSDRRARSSSSRATRTPKCSSAREAALTAPSRSPGLSTPMRTDVSRTTRTYSAKTSAISAGSRARSLASVFGGGVCQTRCRAGPATHCRGRAGPRRATGRPATVTVNSSPASARRRTSPTLFRSSFWGIVATRDTVALLLPGGDHIITAGAPAARRPPGSSTRTAARRTSARASRRASSRPSPPCGGGRPRTAS